MTTRMTREDVALPGWWEPGPAADAAVASTDRLMMLLYSEALAALRRARRDSCKRPGEIRTVLSILVELADGLADRENRDEVADLSALYRYMTYRLASVPVADAERTLAEVERLFATLCDGWIQVLQGDSEAGFPDFLESSDSRGTPSTLPPF